MSHSKKVIDPYEKPKKGYVPPPKKLSAKHRHHVEDDDDLDLELEIDQAESEDSA